MSRTNCQGISVIIPCFNSGEYLLDAIDSVILNCSINYEIIVVNDGSTDKTTLSIIKKITESGNVRVLNQSNQGPAAARNSGISSSSFSKILSLDADNIAMHGYLNQAPALLSDVTCDVVYGDAITFGRESGYWDLSQLNLTEMIVKNQLDTCAVFTKDIWNQVGGYPESRELVGYEDWIFWLKIICAGGRFKYLADVGFKYRLLSNSLMSEYNINPLKKLPVFNASLSYQLKTADYFLNNGLVSNSFYRTSLSEIYGNLSYYSFNCGKMLTGFRICFKSICYKPFFNKYTRCLLTGPIKLIINLLSNLKN